MKELTKVFRNVLSDLYCINWSETDGSDVKKILRAAFTRWKNHKPEIEKMFEQTTELNKFQKTMVISLLLAI